MNKPVLILTTLLSLPGLQIATAQRRPVEIEDCVETRRFIVDSDSGSMAISPDGSRVAFIVKAPSIRDNSNEYTLFVNQVTNSRGPRGGRILARFDKISELSWLGDNKTLVFLGLEKGRKSVYRVGVTSQRPEVVFTGGDIDALTSDSEGRTLAISVRIPVAQTSEDATRRKYGFPIEFGQTVDLTGGSADSTRFKIYVLRSESGHWRKESVRKHAAGSQGEDIFDQAGRLSISPDGNYLTFHYALSDVPREWGNNLVVKFLRERGTRPAVLGLYKLDSRRLELALDSPKAGLAPTHWSADSRSFTVVAQSPIGSIWEKQDTDQGFRSASQMNSFTHLFAVETAGKRVTEVIAKPSVWYENGTARWERGKGPMLVRLDLHTFAWMKEEQGKWEEIGRFLCNEDTTLRSSWASDGKVVIGVHEGPSTAPALFVYNVAAQRARTLIDLNGPIRAITLGGASEIEWKDKYSRVRSGFLIKPPNYEPGKRYPLVIMSKGWSTGHFFCDTEFQTAFAPQPLAAAGFVVLLANQPPSIEDVRQISDLNGYPGHIDEAYNWMTSIESAIDFLDGQGLINRDNIGLAGFSRTSWYVDFMLTHSHLKVAAASSADSGIYNYGSYWLWNTFQGNLEQGEVQMGGPPYGATFENWRRYSPAFNADRVRTPLLMEYTNETEYGPLNAYEFFTALRRQGKPVELFYYPSGEHELDTPAERLASLRRNVDWFRFWMQGVEGSAPAYDRDQYKRWRELRALVLLHDKDSSPSERN
jgi:dipeptidyl aminopeptidase/acylaminoacyl peptidase